MSKEKKPWYMKGKPGVILPLAKEPEPTLPTGEVTPEMMQAVTDQMDEMTRELIDLEMFDFCKRVEKENVGQLNVIRLFLEQKMFEVDRMCSVALNSQEVTNFSVEQRFKIAQLFTLVARIADKRGFVDYLITSRKISFDKIDQEPKE